MKLFVVGLDYCNHGIEKRWDSLEAAMISVGIAAIPAKSNWRLQHYGWLLFVCDQD